MSNTTNSVAVPFRRRIGRKSSIPRITCYELQDDLYYRGEYSDSEGDSDEQDSCSSEGEDDSGAVEDAASGMDMDVDDDKPNDKGKQRAVEPVSAPKRDRKRPKQPRAPRARPLRPILAIHRSHGFVWNQELFVPNYAKDRYIASTSPPSNDGLVSTSWSSTTSSNTDYEIEVVEIRVKEGDLEAIVP